ncbi:hypothetical protein [Paenibacillus sp.]|nr:hypothetical protein [Paenibacillus sp.]
MSDEEKKRIITIIVIAVVIYSLVMGIGADENDGDVIDTVIV